MTFEEKLKTMLTERGMFDEQAAAVIRSVKADEANEAMAERWSQNVEEYPDIMLNILWITAKHHALKYIDAECPLAWFRPLFA